jgi:hypothetical protein
MSRVGHAGDDPDRQLERRLAGGYSSTPKESRRRRGSFSIKAAPADLCRLPWRSRVARGPVTVWFAGMVSSATLPHLARSDLEPFFGLATGTVCGFMGAGGRLTLLGN